MQYFSVISLFPEFVETYKHMGVVGRAVGNHLIDIKTFNPRDFAENERRVDDAPYGGGPGMVMMIEPVVKSIRCAKESVTGSCCVINLTPQGVPFRQGLVAELLSFEHLVFVSGRYEGIDERVQYYVDREYSVGDFILTGGEIPAALMIDVIVRNIPHVLGDPRSLERESHTDGILDYPQYTRPSIFEGNEVPEVLLSGNHREIEVWRQKERLGRTFLRRPELLDKYNLTEDEIKWLDQFCKENDEGPKD